MGLLDGADHFHVHVVHIEHGGLGGMRVGQAHLLDDIISLVSQDLLTKLDETPTLVY